MNQTDQKLKILMIGNDQSGKSTFIKNLQRQPKKTQSSSEQCTVLRKVLSKSYSVSIDIFNKNNEIKKELQHCQIVVMVYDISNTLSLTYIAQMKLEIDKSSKVPEKANYSKELDSKCFILMVNKIDNIHSKLNLKQIFQFANQNKYRLIFGSGKMESQKVLDDIILEYQFKAKARDLIPKKEAPLQPKSMVSYIFGLGKSKNVEQNSYVEKDCEIIEKKIFLMKKILMRNLQNKKRKFDEIVKISRDIVESHSLKLQMVGNNDLYLKQSLRIIKKQEEIKSARISKLESQIAELAKQREKQIRIKKESLEALQIQKKSIEELTIKKEQLELKSKKAEELQKKVKELQSKLIEQNSKREHILRSLKTSKQKQEAFQNSKINFEKQKQQKEQLLKQQRNLQNTFEVKSLFSCVHLFAKEHFLIFSRLRSELKGMKNAKKCEIVYNLRFCLGRSLESCLKQSNHLFYVIQLQSVVFFIHIPENYKQFRESRNGQIIVWNKKNTFFSELKQVPNSLTWSYHPLCLVFGNEEIIVSFSQKTASLHILQQEVSSFAIKNNDTQLVKHIGLELEGKGNIYPIKSLEIFEITY